MRKLLFLLPLFSVLSFSQNAITGFDPVFGPPGTPVSITLQQPHTTGSVSVRIGSVPAPITTTFPDEIRFSVPDLAVTAQIILTLGTNELFVPKQFTVTRLLPVAIASTANVDTQRYTMGTLYGDATQIGPDRVVQAATAEATVVAATAEDADPVLLAVVTDADPSITLSARTTALATLFLAPGVETPDPAEALRRLAYFDALPETTALTAAIQSALDAGNDYLESAPFDNAVVAALNRYSSEYQPPQDAPLAAWQTPTTPTTPTSGDDFVGPIYAVAEDYPRDLVAPGYEGLRKLTSSLVGEAVTDRGLPVFRVRLKSSPAAGVADVPLLNFIEVNPLDWMANLYELDPTDPLLNTPEKVQALRGDFMTEYQRVQDTPIDRMHIKAKPAFRILDPLELGADQLMGMITPSALTSDYLEVPADRPGLYIIRAFSGARFPPQSALLANLPGGQREATRMLAVNIILSISDLLNAALKTLPGDASCAQKFQTSLFFAVYNAVDRELVGGNLSGEAIVNIGLTAAKSALKDYVFKCLVLKKLEGYKSISGLVKVKSKMLGYASLISTGGRLIERLNALGNLIGSGPNQRVWTAQAVEDALVVVGNPWQPRITGFYPDASYRGELVRIDGERFSPNTNENVVTFGIFTTDPENPPATARAEVLAASPSSLIVKVPEEAISGLISVTVVDRGTASSADLPEEKREFLVLADPVITGIFPNPPVAGQFMELRGFFGRVHDEKELIFSLGGVEQRARGSSTSILVRTPNSTEPNGVKVRIRNRESSVVPFTPVLPAEYVEGALINVSTTSDNNVADGDISLREAMLLAAGGSAALGRELTEAPDPRPPGGRYERDLLVPPNGNPGAASRDTVQMVQSRTINLVQALPDLSTPDTYFLGTIDGSAITGDGLRLVGASNVTMQARLIRNFSGAGILLSEGAQENEISRTMVENCGTGLLLQGGAFANQIYSFTANSCLNAGARFEGNAIANLLELTTSGSAHGLHLAGPLVLRNSFVNLRGDGNTGFGVLIENGAALNDVMVRSARSNTAGGIRISGEDTVWNDIWNSPFLPEFGQVHANGGPGIWITSPSNRVSFVNPAGNTGSGILLEELSCRDVLVTGVRSGYHGQQGTALPNTEHGLHIRNGASEITIGTIDGDALASDLTESTFLNCFAGNLEDGIRIEGAGTRNIRINSTVVGAGASVLGGNSKALPNGTNGISVLRAARSVTIGHPLRGSVVVANHTDGAGILMSQTSSNQVIGCVIGADDIVANRKGNKIGLHITDGSYANIIGARGIRQIAALPDGARHFESANVFFGNFEAGLLLESGLDFTRTILPGQVPTGGNVIQNNLFGSEFGGLGNHVGLLLRDGAMVNRIGGVNDGEGNLFRGNTNAAIKIDGAAISRAAFANRIIGNEISRTANGIADPGDPLATTSTGAGIALVNGASGHIIGGERVAEGNEISNNSIGVQILNSSSNQVVGNEIHRNARAGIVLVESAKNTVGPKNQVYRNGTTATAIGGVALNFATNNQVVGNWIGLRENSVFATSEGNAPHGVALIQSPLNVIGDFYGPNTIVSSAAQGVLLSGNKTAENQVANNNIGIAPGIFASANSQAGVLLINGAHHNIIGGDRPLHMGLFVKHLPAPNLIQRNGQDGVRVEGPEAVSNRILDNSITGHFTGLGIQNLNGGNAELPPPRIETVDGISLSGSVDTASVPDGSLVQIFSDDDDEGRVFLGETFVLSGRFDYALPGIAGTQINATVTHANFVHTSEFSPLVVRSNAAGLVINRDPRSPETRTLNQTEVEAVTFSVRALGQPVLVSSLTFRTSGSADESLAGTQLSLYRDADSDRAFSRADRLLAGPATIRTNNANLSFGSLGATIDPSAPQTWFLVLKPSSNTVVNETFLFEIPDQSFITSRTLFSGASVLETGDLPLETDTLTFAGGASTPSPELDAISVANGEITTSWSGQAILERAEVITGPWTILTNAVPPFSEEATEEQRFYRLRSAP